jgi:hypothetical protein
MTYTTTKDIKKRLDGPDIRLDGPDISDEHLEEIISERENAMGMRA